MANFEYTLDELNAFDDDTLKKIARDYHVSYDKYEKSKIIQRILDYQDSPRDLGAVYMNINSYRAPDVVRVVGRTAKKVIVEPVPVITQDSHSHTIDFAWLQAHPVTQAATKSNQGNYKLMIAKDTGLASGRDYYGRVDANDLTRTYQSCEY